MLFRKHNFDVKDAAYMFNQQNVCNGKTTVDEKTCGLLKVLEFLKPKQWSPCKNPYVQNHIYMI